MVREIIVAAKNIVLGGNIKALTFLSTPRQGVFYAGECLFLERMMHPNGDLPPVSYTHLDVYKRQG